MARQVIDYIRQPESMENQSLEHLRNVVEKYPYYHAARLLLLRTLYQMHESSFDEELRKAAIYVPSRKTLFLMFEAENLKLESPIRRQSRASKIADDENRTATLIDNFIDSMPDSITQQESKSPRAVDATIDYMAYLMQSEEMKDSDKEDSVDVPRMAGQDIIDQFLNENEGKFEISDIPDAETPRVVEEEENDVGTGILTEAMARIYIKQHKFDKAIEIIQRISLKNPKKNRYFADQIRFMEKLMANEKAIKS